MRGLVRQIEDDLRQGDAIIVSAAGVEELLRYYYDGGAPVFGLPTSADDDKTRAQALEIIAAHDRIQVIFYGAAEQDPNQVVETTLNANAYEINDIWVDDLRHVSYVGRADLGDFSAVDLQFGSEIVLQAYALDISVVEAGVALPVQLSWTARTPPTIRYKVFLQLLNADGVLVAQRDSEPVGGSLPTTAWQPGETVVDRHALLMPPDLPAGEYQLIVGLYDSSDANARLLVAGDTFFELATITIE